MINIVLYMPEKPANTGNIMRTCAALDLKLHIIGPLPFKIDDNSLRRAGMDYLIGLDYKYYNNYDEFYSKYKDVQIYYITRYGTNRPDDCKFDNTQDLFLMFGRESTGIPKEILANHKEHCIRIPMRVDARSLNLSNCVAIMSYEALRQFKYNDLATMDYLKDEDYLDK